MAFGGENAESYHDEGLTAMMKGDVAAAVQFFTRAIQLDNSYAASYHQLGKCYLRLGEPRKAVELLRQVVARKPNLIPAKIDLGYALLAMNAPEEARAQFGAIIETQPQNARANLGMAHVCFHAGAWENAVAFAQAARMHGGANFATLYLLGRAAKQAGMQVIAEDALGEAEKLIEKSLELTPDSPEGHYLRGEVCFAQGRFGPALEHYRAAEDRADPKKYYLAFGENFTRVDVMAKRGICLQRMGNAAGAKELGKQILAIAPEHPLAKTLADL